MNVRIQKIKFLIVQLLFIMQILDGVMSDKPFSFAELSQVPKFSLKKPSLIKASDGINLAYYTFLPKDPSAIVIFYHGGGFYTNHTYQYIGKCLQENHGVGSYFVDIRGHGNSEGARGDAPSIKQVLEDINTILVLVKNNFPSVPIFLAGHSSGAGLLLNYSAYEHKKDNLYAGYIFLAPFIGQQIAVDKSEFQPFVSKVRTWIYILNQLFKLPLFQHIPAVFFNYPSELLAKDSLIVSSYTYTMSMATTPQNPELVFEKLDKPCVMYSAQFDEQFSPEKIAAYAHYNKSGMVTAKTIPAQHLSMLLQAADLIAEGVSLKIDSD